MKTADTGRRAVMQHLLSLVVGGAALVAAPSQVHADMKGGLPSAGIAEARAELAALVKAEPDWGPVRPEFRVILIFAI